MNNLKIIIALGGMLCMVLTFAACGQADDTADHSTAGETVSGVTLPVDTKETQQTEDSNRIVYTVHVVDEDHNPVTGGMLQFCLDTCSPVVLDENGTARFTGEAADYEVKFLNMPAGYTYSSEEEVFHFAEGETEMTLVLKPED